MLSIKTYIFIHNFNFYKLESTPSTISMPSRTDDVGEGSSNETTTETPPQNENQLSDAQVQSHLNVGSKKELIIFSTAGIFFFLLSLLGCHFCCKLLFFCINTSSQQCFGITPLNFFGMGLVWFFSTLILIKCKC